MYDDTQATRLPIGAIAQNTDRMFSQSDVSVALQISIAHNRNSPPSPHETHDEAIFSDLNVPNRHQRFQALFW